MTPNAIRGGDAGSLRHDDLPFVQSEDTCTAWCQVVAFGSHGVPHGDFCPFQPVQVLSGDIRMENLHAERLASMLPQCAADVRFGFHVRLEPFIQCAGGLPDVGFA